MHLLRECTPCGNYFIIIAFTICTHCQNRHTHTDLGYPLTREVLNLPNFPKNAIQLKKEFVDRNVHSGMSVPPIRSCICKIPFYRCPVNTEHICGIETVKIEMHKTSHFIVWYGNVPKLIVLTTRSCEQLRHCHLANNDIINLFHLIQTPGKHVYLQISKVVFARSKNSDTSQRSETNFYLYIRLKRFLLNHNTLKLRFDHTVILWGI